MKQTAELKNVYIGKDSFGELVAIGNIVNDEAKRFQDQQRVMTSPIIRTIVKGDDFLIETHNTMYKVSNFEVPEGFPTLQERVQTQIEHIRICTEAQLKHRLMLHSAGNTLKTLKMKRRSADRKSNFRAVKRLVGEIKTIRSCYHEAQCGMVRNSGIKMRAKSRMADMKKILTMMEIYNGKAN